MTLVMILIFVVAVIVIVVVAINVTRKPPTNMGTGMGQNPQSQFSPAQETITHQKLHGGAPLIDYATFGQPLYKQPVVQRMNHFAIHALIFGLSTGILGIIFGHIARSQIKKTGERGSNVALAGLIIGYSWVGLALLLMTSIFAMDALKI